jgi:hypothetical protein
MTCRDGRLSPEMRPRHVGGELAVRPTDRPREDGTRPRPVRLALKRAR